MEQSCMTENTHAKPMGPRMLDIPKQYLLGMSYVYLRCIFPHVMMSTMKLTRMHTMHSKLDIADTVTAKFLISCSQQNGQNHIH